MSGDLEILEINQPKITYLKPEDNAKWLDKLINNIEDMKNKISKDFSNQIKRGWKLPTPPKNLNNFLLFRKYLEQFDL